MSNTLQAYDTLNRQQSRLDTSEWDDLTSYIEMVRSAIRTLSSSEREVEKIEEGPPSISETEFQPGGWIGRYPGNIEVHPNRISSAEYRALQNDTRRWVETIGSASIAATMPLQAEVAIDQRTRLATYSQALIQFTESVLSTRLPVQVERTEERGTAPAGRPLFQEIVKERAAGSQQIVSESIKFNLESLENLLLIRFHSNILGRMRELASSYSYYWNSFKNQIRYHEGFLNQSTVSQLVDLAIDTDFTDPRILADVSRTASGEMEEIVDLWEAYQRDIGMELNWSDSVTTAVKPVSKSYELWCLTVLLDLLEELIDESPTQSRTLETKYQFGDQVALYYTRGFKSHSRFLRENFEVSPGRPDFALEVNGELQWVGDAKYTDWPLTLSDYQRFITYLVDLLPSGETISPADHPQGTFLYLDEDQAMRTNILQDYQITHLSVRPNQEDGGREYLREILRQALGPGFPLTPIR